MAIKTQGSAPSVAPHYLKDLDYSIVQQCIHCGMCLPTCPTYDETLLERNSPRGRIAWMRAIADGEMSVDEAFGKEMYYCLGCLACVSACPAGVDYPRLFEMARAQIEHDGVLDRPERRFWRWLAVETLFMRPRLLRLTGTLLRLWQMLHLDRLVRKTRILHILYPRLAELEPMTPRISRRFSDQQIGEIEKPANDDPNYLVGFLTGCVQDLAFSDINRDTVDVLLANGCAVHTPRNQGCCGSLHMHNGVPDRAAALARRMIDAFDLDRLDAIISNAGGCGSHLRHLSPLLKDDPEYAARAAAWDGKLKDIHEWLDATGIADPPPLPAFLRATYHPSCHLHHGQKVQLQPENLLRRIPNLELVPLTEATWCCGSAGIYNITQPEQAGKLQERKVGHIRDTGADLVLTANPGCHLQLQTGLQKTGTPTPVMHPISLLAKAYRRDVAL